MGDNHCVSEAFVEPFKTYANGCSLLVDECTFPEELIDKAEKHSTPSIVAKLTVNVNAKMVAITHFSQRITHKVEEEPGCVTPEQLVEQVQKFISSETSDKEQKDIQVIAAEDYLEVTVPRMG